MNNKVKIDHYAPLPFRNWSAFVAIGSDKNGEYERPYDADTITTEPEYLIMLKKEE